jgi:hypothetical protein
MNLIGFIIVAGNVRRSAQVAIGDYYDISYLMSKRWDIGVIPSWRAMSNNSVVCDDTTKLGPEFWAGYEGRGEPFGLINLKLSREIGRLWETQYPDPEVEGYNPCCEQSLANGETCCLAEIFLPNITSFEELMDVATLLYRINKHSLLLPSHQKVTEDIVHRNMRMGIVWTSYAILNETLPRNLVCGSPRALYRSARGDRCALWIRPSASVANFSRRCRSSLHPPFGEFHVPGCSVTLISDGFPRRSTVTRTVSPTR